MVKFLGLYDAWGSFLDSAPSVHEAPRACKRRTTLRDKATGKTHPYMAGQTLPAKTLGGRGASNNMNLTLKDMTLNDLILKEFGLKLKRKIDVFSKVVACADAT